MTIALIFFLVGYACATGVYLINYAHFFGFIRFEWEWRWAVDCLVFGCWYTFIMGLIAIACTL